MEPGELVGQEVQVGDAASGPEVAGVRPGVQGPHGDDEAEAVGAGDVTAAPGPGKRDQPADWDTIGDSPRLRVTSAADGRWLLSQSTLQVKL